MGKTVTERGQQQAELIFEELGSRGGSGYQDGEDDDDISGDDRSNTALSDEEELDSEPEPDSRTDDEQANGTSTVDFQPGAIVRVTVDNFVTYEHADFLPGPNLNMIIGPNGTGKSSLVCAICLGLGYHSNVLGRATSFGEFVKHGRDHATVEIELQGGRNDPSNWLVRLRINREDNSRKFWINGREAPQKKLHKLTRHLRIQIDNLCQFLPQDKVAEFAALNSVDLLAKTLQAAASPEMIEWQAGLKELFAKQKEVQGQLAIVTEKLKTQESRQQNLQQDVQRLREREQVKKIVEDLLAARVLLEYTLARNHFNEAKQQKTIVRDRLKQLEEECGPSLQAVNRKVEYERRLAAFTNAQKEALAQAEQKADEAAEAIEVAAGKTREFEAKHNVEKKKFDEKKTELSKIRTKITQLEAQLKQKPHEFNASEWNVKLREQEHLRRDIQAELREKSEEEAKTKEIGQQHHRERLRLVKEIEGLDSQQGQMLSFLRKIHPDAASGWKWIQENQDGFEKEVFGPPMIICSVKDDRYSDLVQSVLQRDDFFCFTTQSRADHRKLSEQFYKVMGLTVTIRTCLSSLGSFKPPLPREQLTGVGLDGYVLDYIDGPEPVLAMLCNEKRIHASGVALKDISTKQYDQLVAGEAVNSWAAGKVLCRVVRRREYGPDAVSTTTRLVQRGQFWADQPIDAAEKTELQQRLDEAVRMVNELMEKFQKAKQEVRRLREQDKEIAEKQNELRNMKNELQKAYNEYMGLGPKIEETKKREAEKRQDLADTRGRMRAIAVGKDKYTLQTAKLVLAYKDSVAAIQLIQQELLDLRIRLIEAGSEVQSLKDKNEGISQQVDEAKKALKEVEESLDPLKRAAKQALDRVQQLLAEGDDARRDFLTPIAARYESLDQLDEDMAVERSKLELIRATNPNALREFEERELDIDRLTRLKARGESDADEIGGNITALRERWEPRLDELVGRINDAFSYNFEQISCAGEVGVHKDEDFDKWAIEIKVKFRENETLQRLDQHRQSGGERAVSTIFYLMALQAMAQAPFRVVDEINQGMDPRNERMVHERMVEIACREHTSQYFLITPKLLPGLRYDERMRVLCIASGEHMPAETDGRRRRSGVAGGLDCREFVRTQKALMAAAAKG